jgi:hypothetical protein
MTQSNTAAAASSNATSYNGNPARAAALAARKSFTADAHLKTVRKSGSRKDKDRHAIGCTSIHIETQGCLLTIYD